MGRALAREHPADADLVIAVPDSAVPAAIGYAEEAGLPYREGLIKSRYVGRTFIQPAQAGREEAVRLKFNPLPELLSGKRVVVVDDSIVRGTTTGPIVAMLRRAGAAEVHVRIHSPEMKHPCYMGVDTGRRDELIAGDAHAPTRSAGPSAPTRSATCRGTGCSTRSAGGREARCTACFDGDLPDRRAARARQAGARARAEPMARTYRDAGVDVEEAERAVERIARAAASTLTPDGARRRRRLRRRSSASTRRPIPTRSSSAAPMASARS